MLTSLEHKARELSGFHAMYIGNFIGETIGRLESMATIFSLQEGNLAVIDQVLKETHRNDPRFSGFYWISPEGDINAGSNESPSAVNFSDRGYFQQAIKTGKTQISEAHIGRVTGRYVISIATPMIDGDRSVVGVLIGSIQLEKMNEIVRNMARGELVQLLDQQGNVIIGTEHLPADAKTVSSAVHLEQLPWRVNSIFAFDYNKSVFIPFLICLLIGTIFLHFAFLVAKQLLMRREMAKEMERVEADKLKLIGLIAASTAHEIRNPLTGIKGFITLLREKYTEDKDQYYFSLIQTEIDRINSIVNELLLAGKPMEASKETIRVGDALKELAPLIESEAGLYHVQLEVCLTAEPDKIQISKDHFKQIVLNLVKNALEAMESGGKLTIVSERGDNGVLLKLKDTGTGMSAEVLKKLFVPFFTMKKNGTGLGLMVCKRIVDMYDGEMSIVSAEGQGTEVTLQFRTN